jgi:hypothetical protein
MIEASSQLGAHRSVVQINWVANPFRGDQFERIWRPAAAAVINYGAHGYAFLRSKDDPLQFTQLALFDNEVDFDRYWYSDEIADVLTQVAGLYQVPVLPTWQQIVDFGSVISQLALNQ